MIVAIKRVSQVATHMAIAFGLAYTVTGSVVYSGFAVLLEPVINVFLLPFHQAWWERLQRRLCHARMACLVALEKLSQIGLHMGVAFAVTYMATGSLALGGALALLEPVCNVLILPLHDRLWKNVEASHVLALFKVPRLFAG